jgi:hypothetical protein
LKGGQLASQGGFVGILQGADNKTYIVRSGDRLLDGSIPNDYPGRHGGHLGR